MSYREDQHHLRVERRVVPLLIHIPARAVRKYRLLESTLHLVCLLIHRLSPNLQSGGFVLENRLDHIRDEAGDILNR
jgi:hypothetical protein